MVQTCGIPSSSLFFPLVTLGAGIVSLYIDPKENQKGRRILLVVLVVAAIGSVVVAISDDRDKRSSDQKADAENQQLEKTVENQSKSLENLTGKADTIIARLSGFGLGDATVTQITRSLSADKARQSLLPQVREEQGSDKPLSGISPSGSTDPS